MNITIEPGASALLDALHRAGFAAYAVGGCVRDSLLGLAPHDWDLCTAARPEQVMELFGEKQCIPTGLQHGTVTVKRDGRLYEITTFRTEGSYSDGRHPDRVAFVPDVREDLARRDFTINAMAYSAEEGLCDPFGGQEDLVLYDSYDDLVDKIEFYLTHENRRKEIAHNGHEKVCRFHNYPERILQMISLAYGL